MSRRDCKIFTVKTSRDNISPRLTDHLVRVRLQLCWQQASIHALPHALNSPDRCRQSGRVGMLSIKQLGLCVPTAATVPTPISDGREGKRHCAFFSSGVRAVPSLWGTKDPRRAEASRHGAKTRNTNVNTVFASRLITTTLLSREDTALTAHLAPRGVFFFKLVLVLNYHNVVALGPFEEGSLRSEEKAFSTAESKHVIACRAIRISRLMKEGFEREPGRNGTKWVKRQNKKPNKCLNTLSDDEEVNWIPHTHTHPEEDKQRERCCIHCFYISDFISNHKQTLQAAHLSYMWVSYRVVGGGSYHRSRWGLMSSSSY